MPIQNMEANMSKTTEEEFGSKLRCLGGRISYPERYLNQFIDIEEFFLEATQFVYQSNRLAECIENWIYTFGFIISPAKVKSLIKQGYEYDSAVLGVFCEIISKTDKKQISLTCLKPFIKKKKSKTLRNVNSLNLSPKKPDKLWIKFNILTNSFKPNHEKFLLDFEYILKKSPEIHNRILGIDIIAADYQAFLKKESNKISLRQISLKIHAHYSNLHKVKNRITAFGLTV